MRPAPARAPRGRPLLPGEGALDPNTPVAQGGLRASHRRLDAGRSLPHHPCHTHDRVEPLTPGELYEVQVEVWPTCIVVPPGYRVALTVRGKDYEKEGGLGPSPRSPTTPPEAAVPSARGPGRRLRGPGRRPRRWRDRLLPPASDHPAPLAEEGQGLRRPRSAPPPRTRPCGPGTRPR
ncbi:MAG: CocE/NonD family hydrolase C-terminal non-catalytic domain-containing protein [Candidatus Dormibacterales bacterium]